MLSKFHIELRRDTIAVGLLVSAICNQSIADTAIVFNPSTYMIDGNLVLTPTPNIVIWEGGSAWRAGDMLWVGNGWDRFPGGQSILTERMLDVPDPVPPSPAPRHMKHRCDDSILLWGLED